MSELLLTGLDGKNPLGFLAALGVLNAVADHTKDGRTQPKLAWRSVGTYRPVLVDGPERDALLDLLLSDAQSFGSEPALELRYDDDGSAAHDLKPPPAVFAQYLRSLVATEGQRSLAFAAAFATDVAVAKSTGNTKPTALHFTAGQQQFLVMVDGLREGVTRDDFAEALFGPWRYTRALPVLQWDNSQAREYALRADNPSNEKKLGVPAADWLAFRGLPFFRVAAVRARIVTTGCRGGRRGGEFYRWPVWTSPLCRSVISSLVSSPEIFDGDLRVLRARGVPMVFEARINRHPNGGRGSFSPASVARPAAR